MSQWIKACNTKPPSSLCVLLYIVTVYENTKNLWHEEILTGFWGDEDDWEKEGWYIEKFKGHDFFEENSCTKVIAWTMPPQMPYIKFENQDSTELLNVFLEKYEK